MFYQIYNLFLGIELGPNLSVLKTDPTVAPSKSSPGEVFLYKETIASTPTLSPPNLAPSSGGSSGELKILYYTRRYLLRRYVLAVAPSIPGSVGTRGNRGTCPQYFKQLVVVLLQYFLASSLTD